MQKCHLPIQHPEYLYPPSRNPYWSTLQQKPEFKDRVYSDNRTEEHRGSWRPRFGAAPTKRPLHVEIGCNAGHVVVEWAARNPAEAYIGLDWKFKMISKAADKAVKRKIDNLLFFRAHAERLHYMFAPGEIDFLYLYFPDPWAKKSQWRNRFVTAAQLRLLAPLVRPGGIFHIKTDHRGYFDWMERAVAEVPELWKTVERSTDLHAEHPAPRTLTIPDVTLFEGLFIKDGIKINSLKLESIGTGR